MDYILLLHFIKSEKKHKLLVLNFSLNNIDENQNLFTVLKKSCIRETVNPSMCANNSTIKRNKEEEKIRCHVSGVGCQLSGVRCQVSGVLCHVAGARCHVSHVTVHIALAPTATATDHQPADSPNMHSRMLLLIVT